MRILVTGATGFAGRWLMRELDASGHVAIPAPSRVVLDITDVLNMGALVASTAPDAIAHLAGLAYGPDARRDPEHAMAVNAGGTRAVLAAASAISPELPVLVVSSSEVYGHPNPDELPINESAPLRTEQPYGRSKVAVEQAVVDAAAGEDRRIVIVRPFNHSGPGQRLEFVIPALAQRVLVARAGGTSTIVAGNVDVRRDFSDVRDVVRAYRLILEGLAADGACAPQPSVYNVASGRSTAIRDIVTAFGEMAGLSLDITIDPELVRADDPPDIRGDASLIAAELNWRPTISFETTLRDVFTDAQSRVRGLA